ncbi:MAG: 6-bladed beta-propeller [bacterium]
MNTANMRKIGFLLSVVVTLLAWHAEAQSGPQDHFVFEPNRRWGTAGTNDGQFSTLNSYGSSYAFTTGISFDGTNLFVADVGNNRIQVFDKTGGFIRKWSGVSHPCGLAVDDANVFVANRGTHQVLVYSKAGTLLRQWGGVGSGQGQFNSPQGIAVDTQRVYVADTCNHRIQVFDKNGVFIKKWGTAGAVAGQFNQPIVVALDSQYVYVLDLWNFRVQIFDKDGGFVRSINGLPINTFSGSSWASCASMAVDEHNVYVVVGQFATYLTTWTYFRIYDKKGQLVYAFEDDNAVKPAGTLHWPSGIAAANPMSFIMDPTVPGILPFRRVFRTLGTLTPNSIPLVDVLSVNQRNGVAVMDVDYLVNDDNDPTVTVRAGAFAVGSNAVPNLADFVPMRTFVDGTAVNAGTGVVTRQVHRLSWDMAADGMAAKIPQFGNVKVSLMAKDNRGLLDFHFLNIPAMPPNAAFKIDRTPLQQSDFLPLWFWLLAAGDTNLNLTTGTVFGVSAPYAGTVLAQGTNTTASGRAFLFDRLNVREATASELKIAREASTTNRVSEWTPRQEPPWTGYKVNAFTFVTSPTNGWWVVPLTP